MEKRFLAYQILIEKQKNSWDNKIGVNVVIRNVGAANENEALGKFIKETKNVVSENMEVQQKLDPIVFELDNLLKID